MDALLLMTGVSSPGISVGRENGLRNNLSSGKVTAVASQELPASSERRRRGNWALDMLLRPRRSALRQEETPARIDDGDRCVACGGGESEGCVVGEDEEVRRKVFDRESFSRLLERVSLVEAQFFAKMSYLGSLAYCIQKIKPANLLRNHGLRFVTSSLAKKAKSLISGEELKNSQDQTLKEGETIMQKDEVSEKDAYQSAASAASYIHSQMNGVLPSANNENCIDFSSINEQVGTDDIANASFLATTNSVTAVVRAKEETKQAIAEDLNSAKSSPCEWYICDDDNTSTRYFVIQGSETIDSWKTNLLFEPVEFEGLDVLVHRGIYEAAKGIYQQMLPEIREHLKSRGSSATLRFTGHSLGGSLGLLVNLMLLIRGEAPASSLLPIITFGAPSILCGGDYLLRKLGLPKSHVQAISMHRDIVPRAFSCHYPDHVANILKTVNSKFRNLSCLTSMKLMYAPMGKFFILQPEEKYSPNHHLLPPGSGLYLFGNSQFDSDKPRLLQEALLAFLSSPHPLEILSDRSAYGSQGTVYRDHDPSSYLRSVRNVVYKEFKLIRKAWMEQQNQIWGPVVALHGIAASYLEVRRTGVARATQNHFSFGGAFAQRGRRLKRFTRLVTSQNIRILAAILIPAQLLLLDKLSFFSSSWLQC